ncbi:MAG: hypothetical protein DLM72_02960 [Candidatus Nitrosopolaris wilkensis]|nr:MAG: hypothetical protein DLM72_02960 [Candidatus Nitrosopolaris wilkensis]
MLKGLGFCDVILDDDDVMLHVIIERTLREAQMFLDKSKLQIEVEDSTETAAIQRCEDNFMPIEHERAMTL